jgi:hypothetical protein
MSSGGVASFKTYTEAVDALLTYFHDRREVLLREESPSEYSFDATVQFNQNWQKLLIALLEKLRAASFRCTLTLSAGLYQWEFRVTGSTPALALIPQLARDSANGTDVPEEAVSTLEAIKAAVEAAVSSQQNLVIDDVLNLIDALNQKIQDAKAQKAKAPEENAPKVEVQDVKLTLRASLSKHENHLAAKAPAKIVYYLFVENLVKDLKVMSLGQLESDFCKTQKRTVIVIFDSDVSLGGEHLTILGKRQYGEFATEILKELTKDSLTKTKSTLDLRRSESLGDFRTDWLTPEFFTLDWKNTNTALIELQCHLRGLQALLSALFLADFVDKAKDSIGVEYRGIRVARFQLDRTNLFKPECAVENVYELFTYAYEGFSVDKLEVVQQFLSLMVTSDLTLCAKSAEVKEAAQKTYAVVLRDKVSIYFDALNKIQERLKEATDKSAESVINLSRDVSGDLYKIVGVLTLAAAGALLKPDLGWPVGLAASLVISTYLALVIFYYLTTLERAYHLGLDHYYSYVNSFKTLLGDTATEEFLQDENLSKAKDLFLDRTIEAEQLYAGFLFLSLIMALISTVRLLSK